MKKFLVLLLTLMLSVCCAFAVACGDTGNSGTGNGGNNDNTGSGGDNNPPDPLVTESEFNSAMDVTDAPFQVVIVETETDASGVDDQFTMTVNYNSNKIYWTESYEGLTEEGYYSNESGAYYKYEKENGVWQKEESDVYLSCLEYCSPHTVIADELHIDIGYSDFTYNNSLKAYVYTASMDGFTVVLTITFENAKVVAFKAVISASGSLEAEMVEYTYTYNDTAVTLPSVSGNTPVNPNPGGDDNQGGEIVGGDSDCQHVWLQVSLNEGIMTYDCEKCGADKTENKTALYKNVSASIADSIYALADGKDQGASKFGASISKEEYVWEDADWSVHGINVKGVVMFVKMLSEMMSNVDFNVTSAPVKFTFSYSSSVVTENGNAILMYTFDGENGKVTMYWLVESTVGSSTTEIFMYIDVDYDFNSNSLVGFAIEESVVNEYVNMVFGYKYNADEFKYTEDENFVNQIQATASVLQAELDNVIDLKADFTKEYSAMMDEMNGGGDNPNPDNPNPDNPNTDPNPSVIPQEICGVYELSCLKVSSQGISLDISVGEALPDNSGVLSVNDFVITLKDDGTYRLTGELFTNEVITGTFEYVDGEIIFDLERVQSEAEQISVYFENEYLVLTVLIPSDNTTSSYYTVLQGSDSGDIPVDPNPDNPNPGDKPVDPNPDEPDDGISAEWKALFDLENVTVNLDSILDAYWLINGDTWFAHIDQNAVDNVVQDFVEVWYNGNESYRINGVYLDDEYVLMGEYTEYDNISQYLDIYLLYELNDFANSESYFKLSVGSDGSECYAASEVYVYGYLAYTNVQIKVVKGRLESITYTIPNGYEIEGEKYDLTNTLMFTNYGETVGHFPVFDTPVDPEEPKPEDPILQDFIFAFKSITYGETEYKIGDTLYGNLLTADFAKFTLYADGTATIVADGKTSAGYYEIFGDEIMVELTDASNGSLLNFYLQYDEIENYISFNLSGFTYKFDMPENVTYEDLLGEYVDCQTFYVDKVVSGDNTFKVGDTLLNGNVLTADFVVLKVFENGLFKLTTPQTTIRGEYEIDRENGIVNAYYLEDDEPSVIEIAMSNHGATLCFDMYGITYYLNVEGYEGGEVPEPPSISSVFYVQSVIFEGETYYVGDQFLGETLSPEWATFNYFESDNTFILFYNGNVIEGSWENVDETLTQLYYTNANGEVCVIDVTLIQETKSLELTIDGYTILFDFTYSEGGDEEYDITVTEEEFNSAIDLREVPFFVNVYATTVFDGTTSQYNSEVIFKNGNLLAYQYVENTGMWVYYINVDGTYHLFNSEDLSTWEEVPDYPAEMGYMQAVEYYTPYGMIDTLKLTYADFTYDEEYGYYVYSTTGEDGSTTELRLGFINGVAQYVEVNVTQTSESMSIVQNNQSYISLDFIDIYFPTYEEVINGSSNVGGDVNEKVYGVYKLVRLENIVGESAWNYYLGEEFHGEILSEDDFTLTLYRDGSYKIAGYLYAEMEGSFVYENGELILDLENIQSEYEQISVYFENDNLIFAVVDSSEEVKNVYYTTYYGSSDVTGGDDQYEDATWGKVYKAYQVEYDGEVYSFGDTLPNGALIDENWIVVEVYSNNAFYLTISSINYHIEGKWENVDDTLTKLSYIDEEGDECSLYVEVDNEAGLYTLEISGYYITLELHYSSEDNEQQYPSDTIPSTLLIGISPDYEPFAFYDMDGQLVGFDIDLIKAVASVLGYSEDQIEFVVVDEFSSLLPGLGRGEYDIAMSGVILTPEREEEFIYTDSYVSYLASYEDENGELVQEYEDYVIFGYENDSLIQIINEAVQKLNEEGFIDQLADIWLVQDDAISGEQVIVA